MYKSGRLYLGLNTGIDPAAALVSEGIVLSYCEEERFTRIKHAPYSFPLNAISWCLQDAGVEFSDIDEIVYNWNLEAFSNGTIANFYDRYNATYPVDPGTRRWQQSNLANRDIQNIGASTAAALRRRFDLPAMPVVSGVPHHFAHAFQAFGQSGFGDAVCLTLDGSGDTECTVIWACKDRSISPLYIQEMPHSLGWFYAAVTEYLGFEAYDGEYKVMGLAPYGEPDADIASRLGRVLQPAADGIGYTLDGRFIHWGPHSHSSRFTDDFCQVMGRPSRLPHKELTQWHKNVAYEAQRLLEVTISRMVAWGLEKTGFDRVCVGGGVGLNVKMNQALFQLPQVVDVFAHPLCGDNGGAAGAALLKCFQNDGFWPEALHSLSLGYRASDASIEADLNRIGVAYERVEDGAVSAARALAAGRIIGWVEGRAEAGPRALGHRSILADPRTVEVRDRVNEAIKYRELWRPFCPSVLWESMPDYFHRYTRAPFMVIAFDANEKLKADAPAVVHLDGTARVQTVEREHSPKMHSLISEFKKLTGVPVVLNTSFNLRGEPVVNTTIDALRTFYSSGLDELYISDFIVRKEMVERGHDN